MKRIIYIDVTANRARVSSNAIGTQGEVAVTSLSVAFDSGWDGLTKRLLWRTADGEKSAYVTLSDTDGCGRYVSAVPALPLSQGGCCSLTLEGFAVDGDTLLTLARSVLVEFTVEPNDSFADREAEAVDASLAQQLQVGLDELSASLDEAVETLTEQADELAEIVDGKANKSHGHTASEVVCYGPDGMPNMLQGAINELSEAVSGKAAADHTHNFSAADISYNGDSDLNAAVSALEGRKTVSLYDFAFSADGWRGESAPYYRALSLPSVRKDSLILISVAPSCSDEGFLAADAARLRAVPENGGVTVKAYGTRPTLPIQVRVAVIL